ncbi:MAG: hypothetical protein IH598_13120 [Bacteroidales bacterium]|nr:hypothetical protein [Bacteroidales bacterium]
MKINRDNYGAFFLDYWESNLDDQEKKNLALFLKNNPDLQDEFFDFKHATTSKLIHDDLLVYPNKKNLRKIEVQAVGRINQNNWEHFVIASLENDLSPSESQLFTMFVENNPQVVNEIKLFKRTYLKSDPTIIFDKKKSLKHKIILLWWYKPIVQWGTSIAALLLIAFSLFWNTSNQNFNRNDQTVPVVKLEQPGLIETEISPPDNQLSEPLPVSSELPEVNTNLESPSGSGEPKQLAPEISTTKATNVEKNNSDLTAMTRRTFSSEMLVQREYESIIEKRDDISSIFTYMLFRDGQTKETEAENSTAGRMIARMTNSVSGKKQKPIENVFNPMLSSVTEKGKDLLTIASEALPIYQTTEGDGRKETFFALSENFNIRLSRNKAAIE